MIVYRQSPCRTFSADLASYLDGTISPERRGPLATHLESCESCSKELAELGAVRAELASAAARMPLPSSLESRLVSIAGQDSQSPLWISAKSAPELPSIRAKRRRIAGAVAVSSATMLVMVFALALMVSPDLRPISDPTKLVERDYAVAEAAVGLGQAVGAVLYAEQLGLELARTDSLAPRTVQGTAQRVSEKDVLVALSYAALAIRPLAGEQQVGLATSSGFVTSRVVVAESGDGQSLLGIKDQFGEIKFAAAVDLTDRWSSELDSGVYEFYAFDAINEVAGKHAAVLEARSAGRLAARWWLSESGQLLWAERYTVTGELCLQFGYISFNTSHADVWTGTATQIVVPDAASPTGQWCVGWHTCPESLAGLPLVWWAASGTADAPVMHLTYSNGITTLAVVREPGLLGVGAANSTESAGLPSVRAWQSGSAVVSLATNGSEATLDLAESQLPAEDPVNPDLFWRLKTGLARLLGGSES